MKKFGLVALAVVASSASFGLTIDNTASWDGSVSGGWKSVGQEFTAPSNTLNSVEFFLNVAESQSGSFHVAQYDEGTGSLVGGDIASGTWFDGAVGSAVGLNFTAINASLTVGTHYLAYLTSDNSNVIPFGVEYTNGGSNGAFAHDASGVWDIAPNNSSIYNVMSIMTFSDPVPEPASMVALGLGAAALIRRRKK